MQYWAHFLGKDIFVSFVSCCKLDKFLFSFTETFANEKKLHLCSSGTGENLKKKTGHVLQKNCILLVDEVKIRPTVSYSGGVLNGMAKNYSEPKASSMLCVMMKCLRGGPSLMISVSAVHKLTAAFQFTIVKEAATVVERSGGIVLGSMTDNHKINEQYTKLFTQRSDSEAVHPPDDQRKWLILLDSVHILNWITETTGLQKSYRNYHLIKT